MFDITQSTQISEELLTISCIFLTIQSGLEALAKDSQSGDTGNRESSNENNTFESMDIPNEVSIAMVIDRDQTGRDDSNMESTDVKGILVVVASMSVVQFCCHLLKCPVELKADQFILDTCGVLLIFFAYFCEVMYFCYTFTSP